MNIPHINTGHEPNSELDMAGWCVPVVDLTRDTDHTNSQMSDIPLQLPASANVAYNTSALVTLSEAEGDLTRDAPGLHPLPSQTRVNPWQLVSQCVPSGFTGSYCTSRNCSIGYTTSKRRVESARRALLHRQRDFLAATHQYEVVATKNLASAVERNS